MARRSYDRMYKNYDPREDQKFEDVKEDVSLPQEEKEAEKKEEKITGKVIGGLNLNVRKQPKADGEVITTLRDGTKVEIIETVNEEWYHIASPSGYVMKKYVQV